MIAAAFFLTRHISTPLKDVTDIAGKIAAGDLLINLSMNGRTDEVGKLTHMFGRMTAYLKETAKMAESIAGGDLRVTVKPNAKRLAGKCFSHHGGEYPAEHSKKLLKGPMYSPTSAERNSSLDDSGGAAGAAETATAISETTTTVEEVSRPARSRVRKPNRLPRAAQKAARVAQAGKEIGGGVDCGDGPSETQMESIAESIVRLSEQSQAIGEIIATRGRPGGAVEPAGGQRRHRSGKAGEQEKDSASSRRRSEAWPNSRSRRRSGAPHLRRDTEGDRRRGDGDRAGSKAVRRRAAGDEAGRIDPGADREHSRRGAGGDADAASSQQQLVGMDQVALAMENIKQASARTSPAPAGGDSAQSLQSWGRNSSNWWSSIRCEMSIDNG